MAENRRGKENRFYFSRGQMVLLGAAFTLASVVIFFLGIFVGKSIEERKLLKKEEPLVKIPIKPGSVEPSATPAPPPQPREEITFNDSLSGAANSLAAAEETPGETKPIEKVAKPELKVKSVVAKAEAPAIKIAEKKVEASAPVEDTPKKPEIISAESKEPGKTWRAQVNAFPDERSAKQIVDRLKNKGYNAYVTEVQNRGKNWFRVSVGKYGSRDEADKMVETLRTRENYPKAFAATK
jgi:cell division septation protein DedD